MSGFLCELHSKGVVSKLTPDWSCLIQVDTTPLSNQLFFTHTRNLTPVLFLIFLRGKPFFFYPKISTVSTRRTVKQSLPLSIHNVECVALLLNRKVLSAARCCTAPPVYCL